MIKIIFQTFLDVASIVTIFTGELSTKIEPTTHILVNVYNNTSILWYLCVLPVLHKPEVVDIGVKII